MRAMEATRRSVLLSALAVPLAACAAWPGSGPRVHGRSGASDEDYMRLALELAKLDLLHFGAVLVDEESGRVVGEGQNRSYENPTLHAEVVAIHDYLDRLGCLDDLDKAIFGLRKTKLYTTAEPCPMCMSAIVWARIPKVYYGSSIPFLIAQGQWQIDVRAETIAKAANFEKTKVFGAVLERECNALYAKP